MGSKGDILTGELSKLLAALGASPLPADMCPLPTSGSGSSASYNRTSSWWTVVNPCTETEIDSQKCMLDTPACLRTLASSRSLTSSVSQWTMFDFKKFQLALKVIERSSSFFRIRCNQWVKLGASIATNSEQRSVFDSLSGDVSASYDELGLGLLNFDLSMISFTFQSLGNLYLQLSHEQEQNDKHNKAWLKSHLVFGDIENTSSESDTEFQNSQDQVIRSQLLHSVESLLCAIFDISKTCAASFKSNYYRHHENGTTSVADHYYEVQAELQNCVKITNRFPPHSFVHQIGRYLIQ